MSFKDIYVGNMKRDLVESIQTVDLSSCSKAELLDLKRWVKGMKKSADVLTMESEFVGYTYQNLDALSAIIGSEESSRNSQLKKSLNHFNQ